MVTAKTDETSGLEDASEIYFETVKTLKRKLKACKACAATDDITYLWICVSAGGLKRGFCGENANDSPVPMHQWLNVIDEAASLGANWLILTLNDPLEECEDIWAISKWAQQIHNMTVGLHLKNSATLTKPEVKLIRQLELSKTKVLLRCEPDKLPGISEQEGITVWAANPQPDGERPKCRGLKRMIFVNDKGVLYTCGLVDGDDSYRIGHVEDGHLMQTLNAPNAPRLIDANIRLITPECDGCPALLAGFFQGI
ncbi:MAG: hypothetical protein GX117_05200 [Candidatus Hydrogenedentes bacterium]|nr:hypothetical protein [Candidatus Hydrogenedentota bacterium]